MTEQRLKEIKIALEKCSGPWYRSAHDDSDHPTWDIWSEKELKRQTELERNEPSGLIAFDILDDDAKFISQAPAFIKELIQEVERLTKHEKGVR